MEQGITLTKEETALILKRRDLLKNRLTKTPTLPAKSAKKPKDVILGENRPQGWDSHCDPSKVHKGRLTEDHPLFWFEKNVFQKISNMTHKLQHTKIKELLHMPVQTSSKDRVYHALCHLDALWTQDMLPVSYKHRYEKYKVEHKIGEDNIHPDHKRPGIVYKTPVDKKSWDASEYSEYDENEIFKGDR